MSTVFKISSDSVDTEFNEKEIPSLSVKFVQEIDLYTDREGYYFYYRKHSRYKLITVTFDLDKGDTITKLNILYNYVIGAQSWGVYGGHLRHPKVVQCYYEYLINTATNCWVQMYREDMIWPYTTGEKKAKEKINIRFIETLPVGYAAIDITKALGG